MSSSKRYKTGKIWRIDSIIRNWLKLGDGFNPHHNVNPNLESDGECGMLFDHASLLLTETLRERDARLTPDCVVYRAMATI